MGLYIRGLKLHGNKCVLCGLLYCSMHDPGGSVVCVVEQLAVGL